MSELLLPEDLKINLDCLKEKAGREPQAITAPEVEKEVFRQFQKIADELINHYCIVKKRDGLSSEIVYHFMELEFYYCSPEHPDVITYPRNAEAGDWFFHASGVDICFESKVELNPATGKIVGDQDAYGFGGILIRALRKQEEGKTTYITGPLNCCYELFDRFSAFYSPANFPVIEKDKHPKDGASSFCRRYFHFSTSLENKLSNIYQEYWEQEIDGVDESKFGDYLGKSYRFFDDKSFQAYRKYRSEEKSCKAYNAIPSKEGDDVG